MSWTPDEPPDDEQDDSPDDELPDESSDQSAPEPHGPYTRENPLTFLVPEPILLRIERVEKPGAAPGEQPVAFTRAGPDEVLLAVNAYPAPLVDAFFASDAFGEPVIVVGAAWEDDGDDAEPHFPLVIGAVLRFPENRKYPSDFELEVDDLMRSILEGRAMDARQKQIDNLLGGL